MLNLPTVNQEIQLKTKKFRDSGSVLRETYNNYINLNLPL